MPELIRYYRADESFFVHGLRYLKDRTWCGRSLAYGEGWFPAKAGDVMNCPNCKRYEPADAKGERMRLRKENPDGRPDGREARGGGDGPDR